MSKIRFQADADLNQDIVTGVKRRHPEVDFQTAFNAGLRGLNDLQVLTQTASENRLLVSHDLKTMPQHFAAFVESNLSPGVLIVSQSIPVDVAIEELILIWTASEPEDWVNRLAYIPL